MKILVLSDSHGHDEYVYSILSEHPDSDYIIHLGDGWHDLNLGIEEIIGLKNKPIIVVKGNCDLFSDSPTTSFENIGNHKFYITHGYIQHVKINLDYLFTDAKKNGRDIALFGHTHIPFYEERCGIHLFNPGAVMNGSYGIITINSNGSLSFNHFSL